MYFTLRNYGEVEKKEAEGIVTHLLAAIVMSTYNGEAFVAEQIQSLLDQKGVGLDIFIRDDGSNDGTPKILQKFEADHTNIHVTLGENVGIFDSFFAALKVAVEKSEATSFFFCDQDDVWDLDKVRIQSAALTQYDNTAPIMNYGRRIRTDEHGIPYGEPFFSGPVPSMDQAILYNRIPGCTTCFSRSAADLLLTHLPEPGQAYMHDWWVTKVLTACGQIKQCPNSLVLYRLHDNNEVAKPTNYQKQKHRIGRILWQGKGPKSINQVRAFICCYRGVAKESVIIKGENLVLAAQGSFAERLYSIVRIELKHDLGLHTFLKRLLFLFGFYKSTKSS